MSDGIDKLMHEDLNEEELDTFLSGAIQARFDRALRKELANDLENDYSVFKKNTSAGRDSTRRRRLTYYLLATAAGFLLILLGFNFWGSSRTTPQDLAMTYLTETEIFHSGTTKGKVEDDEQRLLAINAFNEKKYAEAQLHFSQIEAQTEEDQFYRGVALLLDGQYSQAIPRLELMTKTESPFTKEASWYLTIAYLLTGNNERAGEVLSSIKDLRWNQEKIRELLNALDQEK